jgi:hypothetical protein
MNIILTPVVLIFFIFYNLPAQIPTIEKRDIFELSLTAPATANPLIGIEFKVEIIDTWNMTIKPLQKIFQVKKLDQYKFIDTKESKIELSGKPYLALRIRRLNE